MAVRISYDEHKFLESQILEPDRVRWIKPKEIPPPKTTDQLLEEALNDPVDSKRLDEEGFKSPAIVVSDNMRLPSPYVPQLLRKLEEKTDDIKIMVAGGTHVIPPDEHAKRVLGDLFSTYQKRVIYSSTRSSSNYEYVGETTRKTKVELNVELLDRDFIISTLCIRPHYFAGWEGGAKALLPGCSSFNTIARNHSYVVGNPNARELIMKGNPVREDINEVPGLLEKGRGISYRIADFVPNQANEPVLIRYGRPVPTHSKLTEFGRGVYEVRAEPASLVIVVADGAHGQNFYQGLKALSHASNIVKPSAEPKSKIILAGGFKMGVGNKTFEGEFETYIGMDSDQVMQNLKRRVKEGTFNETLQKINRLTMDFSRADMMVVSPEAPAELKTMLEKKDIFFSRELDDALSTLERGFLSNIIVVPKGPSTVPMPMS
jgi:nickel-dependent lactate racemase